MKYFFCDLETTGTDFTKHGVWQIAGQIVIDGEERERFDLRCRPLPGKLVATGALEACGITMDYLRGLPDSQMAYLDLFGRLSSYVNKYDKFDKFFFVGYNAQFDCQFLRRWFEDHGDMYFGSWFWYPFIDVVQLAGFALHKRRQQLANFKLATVADYFGVSLDQAHDAQNDIEATRRMFDILVADGVRVQ